MHCIYFLYISFFILSEFFAGKGAENRMEHVIKTCKHECLNEIPLQNWGIYILPILYQNRREVLRHFITSISNEKPISQQYWISLQIFRKVII